MRIAIYGKMRSGKSVLADYYKEMLGADVLDFSDSLKASAKEIFPERMSGERKNRSLLISFGQHMRKLDQDVWVKNIEYKINKCKNENIIVTGVRQRNEFEMLRKEGFIFIRVEANLNTRLNRMRLNDDNFNEENLSDNTEIELLGFDYDYKINNNCGMKDLIIDADNVLEDIKRFYGCSND